MHGGHEPSPYWQNNLCSPMNNAIPKTKQDFQDVLLILKMPNENEAWKKNHKQYFVTLKPGLHLLTGEDYCLS